MRPSSPGWAAACAQPGWNTATQRPRGERSLERWRLCTRCVPRGTACDGAPARRRSVRARDPEGDRSASRGGGGRGRPQRGLLHASGAAPRAAPLAADPRRPGPDVRPRHRRARPPVRAGRRCRSARGPRRARTSAPTCCGSWTAGPRHRRWSSAERSTSWRSTRSPERCTQTSTSQRTWCGWCSSIRVARHFYVDWDRAAQATVANLRAAAGAAPEDPRLLELVAELETGSADFRERGASNASAARLARLSPDPLVL